MEPREKIKALRAKTGLSQQKFGMLFKISTINISNWEQGVAKPPEYVLYMLERLIEIDPTVPKKKVEVVEEAVIEEKKEQKN